MNELNMSTHKYTEALRSDSEIPPSMIRGLSKRYAKKRNEKKTSAIKFHREAPMRRERDRIVKGLSEKFGYVDNELVHALLHKHKDFDPFTEDPNCQSCRKKRKG